MYQGMIQYLYSSWHQAVCSGEDELLSVVAVWRGQDNLACPWAVSCSEDELLLGSIGRVHRSHYLDLLTCLLVSYNLRVIGKEGGETKRGRRWKWAYSTVKMEELSLHVVASTWSLLLLLMHLMRTTPMCRSSVTLSGTNWRVEQLPVIAVVLWQAQRRLPESPVETHSSLSLTERMTPTINYTF